MIDSKKFVDNVRYLCGMREMSIGYLEKEIGDTVGYFSRYKNNNTIEIVRKGGVNDD